MIRDATLDGLLVNDFHLVPSLPTNGVFLFSDAAV